MSAEQKSIDPTPLGNITTGIVLLTLWPILFGVADSTAMIAVLPWSAMAFPLVLLTSVIAFRHGHVLGAVANGVMSGLTLCQNAVWALVLISFQSNGGEIPASVMAVKGYVDGAAYLGAAFMLLCIAIIFCNLKNKTMALSMFLIFFGFCCMGVSDLGLLQLRLPAALCITCFALWMIYSGCAMLAHDTLGRKILPY